MQRSTKKRGVIWDDAPDVHKRIEYLISKLDATWLFKDQITCFRSYNSTARAYARIWGLSKVWQLAINHKPHYIIEVLAQNFDKLPSSEKDKVLLHEIAHIPKNFSGSLLPHVRHGKRKFADRVGHLINLLSKR